MARISTYTSDTSVEKTDKLLGSNSGGATKNFAVEDVSKFLRENNAAGVAGQPTYKYVSSSAQGAGTVYVNGSTPLAFSHVTTLRVSKYRKGDDNSIENFLETFQGNDIIVSNVEDLDNFGIFTCSNVAQDASTDFYTITLSSVSALSQGSLVNDKVYAIAIYSVAGDKSTSLTFSPTNFAGHPSLSTDTVNGSTMNYIDWSHNLNKYPSITVTEAFSTTGVGFVPYKYINTNTVRVYFHGGTNGKIYAN